MKNKKAVLALVLVFVLVLGGAYVLYDRLGQTNTGLQQIPAPTDATGASDTQPKKIAVPDFTVYNLQGEKVQLSGYFGKPIVLNFWASWCGPCQMEMPDFQEKYSALGDEVYFLMVNMTDGDRETQDTASKFIEQKGYTFPTFYDKDRAASEAYRVYSLPTTYFIDAEGNFVTRAIGAIDSETLQRGIDMIYTKK